MLESSVVWQFVHPNVLLKSSPASPASSSGVVGPSCCPASQSSKSLSDWAMTRKRMLACDRPQYSAHCPRYVPGFVGGERELVVVPGNDVALAVQLGDPEGVDHVAATGQRRVAGAQRHVHFTTHRDVHFARGDDLLVALARRRVVELPPPLLADCSDFERVRRGRLVQLEDEAHGGHRDDREDHRRESASTRSRGRCCRGSASAGRPGRDDAGTGSPRRAPRRR